jgi:hypothetical protein
MMEGAKSLPDGNPPVKLMDEIELSVGGADILAI